MSELPPDGKEPWQEKLLAQYAGSYSEAQKQYDAAARALAAGGLAVTVSVGTALHKLTGWGAAAVIVFLFSLLLNLLSFLSAQADIRKRHKQADGGDVGAFDWNRWTTVTRWLNVWAGAGVILGAALLGWFVHAAA